MHLFVAGTAGFIRGRSAKRLLAEEDVAYSTSLLKKLVDLVPCTSENIGVNAFMKWLRNDKFLRADALGKASAHHLIDRAKLDSHNEDKP